MIYSSPFPDVPIPEVRLFDFVFPNAETRPDKPAAAVAKLIDGLFRAQR